MKLRAGVVLVALLAAGLVAGCDNFFTSVANCSSVTVSPASPSLSVAQTQQFTATCTLSDGSTSDISRSAVWSSSNSTVASIGTTGLMTTLSPGSTSVTATASNISGSANVTVNAPALTSITVTPANPTISHTSTQQFTAAGTFADNSQRDITSVVTWTSSNTSIATISSTGLATGVSAGTVNITASLGSTLSNTAILTLQ